MIKIALKIVQYVLVLLPLVTTAGTMNPNGKYTKEKKIKKSYTVNSNVSLTINNSYGEVNMISWNEDQIVIEVHVKTNGNDEERVKDKLDEIDVRFDASNAFVSAKTILDDQGSRSWWNSWKSNNVNMEINYTIKFPVTATIDISNDYGGITLDRVVGSASISCDYGRITIGQLMANNNYLNFDYTKNSSIDYIKGGRIKADYSSFTIEQAESIELNADYSKSEFINIETLAYKCDYGSIITKNAGDISGKGDYLSVKLGTVHGNVAINADYGSVRINNMSKKAGNLDIQSDYTGIDIGYDPDYQFRFEVKLEYAGLSGSSDLTIEKERKDGSDRYYEGFYGSSQSTNRIYINSEYGGVTFQKNE